MMQRLRQLHLPMWGGVFILAVLSIYAIWVPMSGSSSDQQDLSNFLLPPSSEFWLGTDGYGREVWLRLAEALRLSLLMALVSVLTAASLGITLGVMAGWGPRWIDRVMGFVLSLIVALPGLVLVLILSAIVPGSFLMMYIGIALVQWVEFYRMVRVQAFKVKSSPAMESSRLMGFGYGYCFARHLWPAIAPQVRTLAAFGAAAAIMMMASLGFIYVGIQPPRAELGLMIVEQFPYYSDAPWLLMAPLVTLTLIVLACHLIAQPKRSVVLEHSTQKLMQRRAA
jgi:peptide/nickel transport system permease protein